MVHFLRDGQRKGIHGWHSRPGRLGVLHVAFPGFGETGRNPALEVGDDVRRGMAVEGGMGPGGSVWIVNGGVDVA
jgi:hypothetical protein